MSDSSPHNVYIECLSSISELCDWSNARLPVSVAPLEGGSKRLAQNTLGVQTAARWALDKTTGDGIIVRGNDGEIVGADKSIYGDVAHIVPTTGPTRPLIAFVGFSPSLIDAARGEGLSGSDGRAFIDMYLAPLNLKKSEVGITHIVPLASGGEVSDLDKAAWQGWAQNELKLMRPTIIVALGKAAGDALGPLAHFVMPHPAAVRRRGDSGEVARKVRKIAHHIESHRVELTPVTIAKSEADTQTIFGVVLDPYDIDQQGDWCPPSAVKVACHDYLENFAVVGLQHEGRAQASVVENFTVQYPTQEDHDRAMYNQPHRVYRMPYGNQLVCSGAWILGVRVTDAATWAKIENGEITSFSIGGSGIRTPLGETPSATPPEVQYIDLVELMENTDLPPPPPPPPPPPAPAEP